MRGREEVQRRKEALIFFFSNFERVRYGSPSPHKMETCQVMNGDEKKKNTRISETTNKVEINITILMSSSE